MSGYEETAQASYDEARDLRVKARPERRPGEILDGRRDRLGREAETLDNLLDALTTRLSPVLLPEQASPLGAVGADSPATSDHGAFLDHLTERLSILGRRLGEVVERIDL